MTVHRLEHYMILTVSRAAQLVYTEDSAAAYAMLSDAGRLFRYFAAPDQSVLLADEIEALSILLRLDPSLDVRIDPDLAPPFARKHSRGCAEDAPIGGQGFGDRSVDDRSIGDRSVGDRSVGDRSVGEVPWPCVFVRRLAVIEAVLNLTESAAGSAIGSDAGSTFCTVGESPSDSKERTVTVTSPPAASTEAVVIVRGGFSLGVACA
jgi:hypothetical protein